MKALIILLLSACFFGQINGQQLNNTYWLGTNPPSPNIWFYFAGDTLYYSYGGTYSPLSLYTDNTPSFSIFDITSSLCPDTGFYTYSITGTNLQFTLVSDVCPSRPNTLVGYNWTQINTAVESLTENDVDVKQFLNNNVLVRIKGYSPNTQIKVFDIKGREVFSEKFNAGESLLNLDFLSGGIYFLKIYYNGRIRTFKLFL